LTSKQLKQEMLNEQQLLYVSTRLEEEGLKHQSVKAELMDHICCAIETKMEAGAMFSSAVNRTFNAFAENEFLEIEANARSLQRYNWLNRRTLALGLLLLFLFSGLYWRAAQADRKPSITPVASQASATNSNQQGATPIYKVARTSSGINLTIPFGTAIIATAKGEITAVKKASDNKGFEITIYHNHQFQTLYAGLSECSVAVGQQVNKGEIIGFSGLFGPLEQSVLHYKVLCKNQAVNPLDYLELKRSFSP